MEDHTKPVKIAEDIYWVGHKIENDPFQCHVYLIKNGKESILIDPGSNLTFKDTLYKIEQIIPFSHIKYFICHHQDPDITAALETIKHILNRDDAQIISHWRAIELIKHYNLNIPFICVERNNWELNANGRKLKFIFTPYLHFPGAFCTYDVKSKILFSSDLFGGFTDEWKIFAEDESYYDSIAAFHAHYMPSKEILIHSLKKIEELDIEMIAPQHGSIIKKHLIQPIIKRLKNLDCGIFLLTQTSTEIEKLRKLNKMLSAFLQTMATYKDFSELIKKFSKEINDILLIKSIEFYTYFLNKYYYFNHHTPLMWEEICIDNHILKYLGKSKSEYLKQNPYIILFDNSLMMPIFDSENNVIIAFIQIKFDESFSLDLETKEILQKISNFFTIAFEREFIRRKILIEKEKYYEISIKDPLTNCYTRHYLHEAVKRFIALQDRGEIKALGITFIDIDDFKRINDTYGHDVGDMVLMKVGNILLEEVRTGDIPVRYGGEEFLIMAICDDVSKLYTIAKRIREKIKNIKWPPPLDKEKITASFGIALREKGEEFKKTLKRADIQLYKAKQSGKNKICVDSST
ncbi:diguanylate cyclase [Deferribacter autotrophicus]|uniref:Diguanylate cyclase n=1 Tax=Deferribacter autotrophicus TaxID=500465 RepID=A0A5A8F3Q8_9BACT|nr:diguanylate cyclase [Deferribacter autotrophicus]KAA0258009.1 diguanylate cyclase [Deferribacter autotrophicus]